MSDEQFLKEGADSNIFNKILQKYIPFWPLFVITIGLSLAIAYIYFRSQEPIFLTNAKVLLKDPNKGSGDSKVLDALNIFSETKIVENEILVLKSTGLMEQVVDKLGLYATVYNQGKVRIEELYKENSPIWFKCLDNQKLHLSSKFSFKIDWGNKQVTIDNKKIYFDSTVILEGVEFKIIANPEYNKTLIGKDYFVVFNSIEGTSKAILSDINASAISNNSTVINVSLESAVSKKGEDILSSLFQIYNDTGIEEKNQIAAKTLAFIQDRLSVVVSGLDSVERKQTNFRSTQGAVDLTAQTTAYLSNVQDLDKRASQVDLQLSVLDEVNNYIKNKGGKPGTVPSLTLINDPQLANLLTKLYDAEFQLDKVKSIAGEKSDAVVLGNEQVSRLKNDIQENLINIRKNLTSEKSNISSNIGQNSSLLSQVPKKELGIIEIGRQQNIRSSIYNYLLQKREETALSSASTTADVRIIETPSSYGPVKPIPSKYYSTAFILGFLISILAIIMKEQFNRKVLFRSEIVDKTSVPVLGEIIQVDSNNPIVISEGKRTVIAEQIRSLRTNLSFMGLNEENKTILVTSSVSGDGKSFIAINLAISFTLTGKKVALLEMDLRKPKLSKLLEINRDPGISNYLINKASITDIIKETSIPNLYLVSSGPIPPNPSELVVSQKFKQMMNELKERFDFLIIDTAPVGPVSDAQLLKEYANTTIFVIRHNYTPKPYLKMIEELNKEKKFKNLCIVFNGLRKRGFSYGSYGYGGYGQSYGYGYGSTGNGYYINDQKKSAFSKIKNIFVKNK